MGRASLFGNEGDDRVEVGRGHDVQEGLGEVKKLCPWHYPPSWLRDGIITTPLVA